MTAMAMACRPDLIVFDEPTTALDVTTQIEVLAAIRDIVEQFNTAALYITHDLAVVAQMADRIMVLRHGKLVEEAPTREMLKTPQRGLHPVALGGAQARQAGSARATTPMLRGRRCRPRAMAAPSRCWRTSRSSVPRGRTVAVVGESGSGKSTLARAITGLLPPIDGRDPFRRQAVCRRRSKERDKDMLRRIQMIYQMADTALNPRQTRARHHRPAARILSRPAAARAATARSVELLEHDRAGRELHRPLSGRAVGRPEAARLHRPRACRRARAHHLRRGHLGARPARRRRTS